MNRGCLVTPKSRTRCAYLGVDVEDALLLAERTEI
jgi:hypothetical protein